MIVLYSEYVKANKEALDSSQIGHFLVAWMCCYSDMNIFPACNDASYDTPIVYLVMRRMTVKIRRHASLLDSGLLRSNKDDRLITRHSPGGILSSWTH